MKQSPPSLPTSAPFIYLFYFTNIHKNIKSTTNTKTDKKDAYLKTEISCIIWCIKTLLKG